MVDMSELTESVKGYIEGLQDVLQRKYQISEEKALNMITSSYIMDSLIDYPEETLHDDIEAHADNIYEDHQASKKTKTERLLLEAGYEGTIFFTNPSYEDAFLGISSDVGIINHVPQFRTDYAEYEITVNYNGAEYSLSDESTYRKYHGRIGQTVSAVLVTKTYDDGEVRQYINRLGGL